MKLTPLTRDERIALPERIGQFLTTHGWTVERTVVTPRTLMDLLDSVDENNRVMLPPKDTWTGPNGIDVIGVECAFEGPDVCTAVTVTCYFRVQGIESETVGEVNHGTAGFVPHTRQDESAMFAYLSIMLTGTANAPVSHMHSLN